MLLWHEKVNILYGILLFVTDQLLFCCTNIQSLRLAWLQHWRRVKLALRGKWHLKDLRYLCCA